MGTKARYELIRQGPLITIVGKSLPCDGIGEWLDVAIQEFKQSGESRRVVEFERGA